jgi:hypothetical protein
MTSRLAISLLWFFLPIGAIISAGIVIGNALSAVSAPGLVANALTVDFLLVIPALYVFVFIRGRGWPVVSLAPVVLACFGLASVIIPDEHQTVLNAVGYAIPALELTLLGYVGLRVRRIIRAARDDRFRDSDFHDHARSILTRVLGVPVVADIIAFEVSLFYYAFALRGQPKTETYFTYRARCGYGAVFSAILIVASAEIVAGHVLLSMWSTTAALIHLALSAYGIIWLLGDFRAMSRRPHVLTEKSVRLRLGIRWDVAASWSDVVRVRRGRGPTMACAYLNMVAIGEPRYILELRRPRIARGPYGLKRSVDQIGFDVDDPDQFEDYLCQLGVEISDQSTGVHITRQ